MGPGSILRGIVQKALPSRFVDDRDNDKPARLGSFGDLKVESAFSSDHLLADEGCIFSGNHASPGGGGTLGTPVILGLPNVAGIIGNAAAVLAIFNSDNPVNQGGEAGRTIWPRKIQTQTEEATVPTGTTQVMWGFVIDSASRLPTANFGGPFIPVNVNGNSMRASAARVYYCNAASGLTLPAAGPAARTIGAGWFKSAAKVAKDVYELQFGGIDVMGQFTQAQTVAQKYIEKCPSAGIGPQQWGIFYLAIPVAAANNVTYEPFVELIER